MPAILLTVLGVVALYLASTWGWAAVQGSRLPASEQVGTLPSVVETPPPSVATTDTYGPIGSVSMVFAGTDVDDGLFGKVDPAWIAVSSQRGDYRALTAPGLPEPAPGAVSVAPAGDRLAWIGDGRLVLYDPVAGESETLSLPSEPTAVGGFSPDGTRLLVHADGLLVLDVESGETVSTFDAEPGTLRRTAWRPDGSAIDFVAGGRLVTGRVPGSATTSQPTDIPADAAIAWSPQGDRLVSLREDSGVKHLFVSDAAAGRVGEGRELATPAISLDRLIGFTDANSVAVVAYALESGALERILDVPLDGGSASDVTTLPPRGENWAGTGTLAIASDALAFGSTDFEEHVWPWSHRARLIACLVVGLFCLGLFATRRPRRR